MKKNILVSWIGFTDLWQMGYALGGEDLDLVKKVTRKDSWIMDSGFSTKTMIESQPFDHVHLLSNFGPVVDEHYKRWLGKEVTFHPITITDPYDYTGSFRSTEKVLEDLFKTEEGRQGQWHIHLSTGTHAMVAVMLLLGATRYPAKFYRTSPEGVKMVDLPFDLTLFIREHFVKADSLLANIAFKYPGEVPGFKHIVGNSSDLRIAVERARLVAEHGVNVLLLGESGVGKELFARAIHDASPRSSEPFVPINCAAIPSELMEAELFGSIKDAGSNSAARDGYLKKAHGGTLFLDELGTMDLRHQAKLLRVIESSEKGESPTMLQVDRVGEQGVVRRFDVRIVAATNEDLQGSNVKHRFRNDLYHRLATFSIQIPPLRERRADIPLIAKELVNEINTELFSVKGAGHKAKKLSTAAIQRLKQHDWPGNVRELKNVLKSALIMSRTPEVGRADIDQEILQTKADKADGAFSRNRGAHFNLHDHLRLLEKIYIQDALDETDRNQRKAAELLGISPGTLNRKLKPLGIVSK